MADSLSQGSLSFALSKWVFFVTLAKAVLRLWKSELTCLQIISPVNQMRNVAQYLFLWLPELGT